MDFWVEDAVLVTHLCGVSHPCTSAELNVEGRLSDRAGCGRVTSPTCESHTDCKEDQRKLPPIVPQCMRCFPFFRAVLVLVYRNNLGSPALSLISFLHLLNKDGVRGRLLR